MPNLNFNGSVLNRRPGLLETVSNLVEALLVPKIFE
jgi:hypothetical protein